MSNTSAPLPPLLVERLVHDRSALAADVTVAERLDAHRGLLAGPLADLVGPLAVHASQVDDLRPLADPEGVLAVSLVADGGLLALQEARHAIQDDAWITLDHVEIALPRGFSPAEATNALLDELAFTVPTYISVPRTGFESALDVLADDGAERADYRCAGDGDAGPTTGELAAFVHGCVDRQVPFTLESGFDSVVRGGSGGDPHHGLLNVLAAVAAACGGAPTTELADLLGTTDVDRLVTAATAVPARTVRAAFHGAGSADVAATLGELTALGLVAVR